MPMTTPAANHQLGTGTPPVTRLVSATGAVEPATPQDVQQRLAAGGFFWLDLESLDPGRLAQFGRSLGLDASATAEPEETGQSSGPAMASTGVPRRPSLAAVGDSIQAVVPAAGGPASGDAGIPVRIVYTAGFLLTSHSGPCPALEQARYRYDALRPEGKTDGSLVLFLVLDDLAGSFEPQFLALDARLDEIQVELLTRVSPGAQAEVLAIRRRLAHFVQSLGWYAGDLDDLNAAGVGQLPGMGPGAQPHFDRHHHRIIRMRTAARDYREEAGDVLGQFSANISGQQGQVINFLAVISAIFLPLTFFTGYFGMNFNVITQDLNSVWIFTLLGNLIPAVSVVLGFVLFRRWLTRLGIPGLMPTRRPARQPPPRPEATAPDQTKTD
jgi:Mg2+ and Co2+ transporter CorA